MRTFTEFHTEKGFRNLNFTSYCRGKATLAKICERIGGVLTPEKVPLHHNKKKEMDDNFVSFFFLVGLI